MYDSSICMHVSEKRLTVRLPVDLYEAIESVREAEQIDRSTAVKRLLQRGVEDWRREAAVQRYRDRELSLGAAADVADVSIWRLLDVLEERNVEVNYSAEDLTNDLEAARNR